MNEHAAQRSDTDSMADAGLMNSLRSSLSALAEHIRLRIEVLQVEGREAALHLLLLAGLLVGAAVFLVFAYLLLLLSAVFLLASATGWSWAWIAVAAGSVHLLVAFILLLTVRQLSRRRLLDQSLEEFKRDSTWLRNQTKNKNFFPKTN